jgi:hypothetical protein
VIPRRLLALAAAALTAGVTAATAGGVPASGDTGVRDASGGDANAQTEQTLAVDPTDPRHILIGYINGVSVSHNGGLTWERVPGLSCTGDGNPAFDRKGVAYFECGGDGVQIKVWRSTNKGAYWTGPVNAGTSFDSADFVDRPWLVAGAGAHDLVASWESFFTTPVGSVWLRYSPDGVTWRPAHRVDAAIDLPAAWNPRQRPVVGADGTIYVGYASGHAPFVLPQTVPLSFVVARSRDHGATFTRAVAAANITRTSAPTEESEAISSLAADPSPRRAKRLALAWADERSGSSRVLVVTSVDGGVHWSKPAEIADKSAPSNQQDHPQVAFAPDGRVVVVWRDRRCCGGSWSSSYQLFARALTILPGGRLRLGRSVQVTAAAQKPNSSSSLDEYLGLSVGPSGVAVAWNQPRGGVAATHFRRLPLSMLR